MLFPVIVSIDVGVKMVDLKGSCVKEVKQVLPLAVSHRRDTRTKKTNAKSLFMAQDSNNNDCQQLD